MKHMVICLCGIALSANVCLAGGNLLPLDKKSRMGYSIGYQVGNDLKQQEIDIRPEMLLNGLQDALAATEPRMTPAEMRATLTNMQKEVSAAMEKKMKVEGERNLAEGRAFLSENAGKKGVITLPSGLQYKVISEGNGKKPGATDVVEVNYRGTLINGKEFDSSERRGRPAQFRLDRVVKGWSEALQLMKTKGKWRLFLPPELAYGNRQIGDIGPNSALIFDIELLAVNPDSKETQIE